MRYMFFFILFLAFGVSVWADTSQKSNYEYTFIRGNKHGFQKIDKIVFKENQYYFNDFLIGRKLDRKISEQWDYLIRYADESTNVISTEDCELGVLEIKFNKHLSPYKSAVTCAQGKGFTKLILNIEDIKDYLREKNAQ